jgi:hypothetical protein
LQTPSRREAAIPAWREKVLAQRTQRLDAGLEPTSPWTEAKQRIREQTALRVNTNIMNPYWFHTGDNYDYFDSQKHT